jgi:hypothetical protein
LAIVRGGCHGTLEGALRAVADQHQPGQPHRLEKKRSAHRQNGNQQRKNELGTAGDFHLPRIAPTLLRTTPAGSNSMLGSGVEIA